MGQFYYAAKAFDALERLDQNPEYWEGKRGACVGIFQLILAGRESRYEPMTRLRTLMKLNSVIIWFRLWNELLISLN